MVAFIANMDFSAAGMNGNSRQECCWGISVWLQGQKLGCMSVGVRESVDFAGIAARDENAPAILAESQAVPSLREWQELGDVPAGNIQQCQAGVAESAAHSNHRLFVRRNH